MGGERSSTRLLTAVLSAVVLGTPLAAGLGDGDFYTPGMCNGVRESMLCGGTMFGTIKLSACEKPKFSANLRSVSDHARALKSCPVMCKTCPSPTTQGPCGSLFRPCTTPTTTTNQLTNTHGLFRKLKCSLNGIPADHPASPKCDASWTPTRVGLNFFSKPETKSGAGWAPCGRSRSSPFSRVDGCPRLQGRIYCCKPETSCTSTEWFKQKHIPGTTTDNICETIQPCGPGTRYVKTPDASPGRKCVGCWVRLSSFTPARNNTVLSYAVLC